MREGADRAVIRDVTLDDDAVVFDGDAVADARVRDARALHYLAALADYAAAFDVNVRVESRVGADLRVGADVCVLRVDEGDAAVEHQTSQSPQAEYPLELRKLDARVDA